MKPSARAAESTQSARPNTRPACAMPAIMSAFQLVRTFSSRPGRTRRSRAANSFARAESASASHSASALPRREASAASGRVTCRCQCCPSKFAGPSRPQYGEAAASSSADRSEPTSSRDQT